VGRWKLYLALTLGAGLASAWLGFRGEQERQETGESSPAPLKTQLKRIFVRPTDAVARLDEIRAHSKRVDLSPPEEEECWQIIRGLSEQQLRSYLADLPTDRPNTASSKLIPMLFSRWAQIDSLAALAEAKKPEYARNSAVVAAFSSWAGRDRDAAFSWALSKDGAEMKYYAADIAARMYLNEDRSTAIERMKSQFPEALPTMLRTMAQQTDGTDESLRDYFDLTRSERDQITVIPMWELVRKWATRDLSHALENTETFGLSPEQLSIFRQHVLSAVAARDPATVLNRLQNGQETTLDASGRKSVLLSTIMSHPEESAGWSVENHQTDLLAEAFDRQISGLRNGKRPLADYLRGMRGPYESWSKASPDTFNAWLQKQPDEVRNALTSPLPNAPH